MKTKQILNIIAIVLLMAGFTGCGTKTSGTFELKGKLSGITEGKAILSTANEEEQVSDTVAIKNGEFVFKGDIKNPAQYIIAVEGKEFPCYFYAENAKMTLTGPADSLFMAVITGGTINEDEKKSNAHLQDLIKSLKYSEISAAYQANKDDAHKKSLDSVAALFTTQYDEYQMDFIKRNPASYYSAILVDQMSYGQSAAELEANLKLLDPSLNDFSVVETIRTTIESLKTTDIQVGDFTSNAPDMAFAVDKSYPGKDLTGIVYLGVLPNDNICCLSKEGVLSVIDPAGKKVGEFKSTLKSTPTTMAIDPSTGDIYVLGTIIEKKEVISRGKSYPVETPKGVECIVYQVNGKEVKRLELTELTSATGAKVANNKLLVADYTSRKVCMLDLLTGKMESSLNDLRTCCRILDFGINTKNEILVANLGAFRVQAFDYTGKIKYAFGKRGQALNDFHGCCNPVNVACLTNGAIITVEKDPTRIKIYTKSGASQVAGIQELVKGCKYIPMTSDSKNNIYLASAQSGIVKCSPAPQAK